MFSLSSLVFGVYRCFLEQMRGGWRMEKRELIQLLEELRSMTVKLNLLTSRAKFSLNLPMLRHG